tara:strand:+ start:3670 stop:5484 length:1815 start_codon:yes stop_codon:yes gene_type:complete
MKKLLFLSYLLIPLLIISQDLDEAYLESLPEDVRNDVLEEMKNREKEESPVYRRPSTMIEKQQALAERLAIARALLDELSQDIDETDIEKIEKPKKRFGTSIFNLMQSSFMPINEPNFDGSYILDFGDVIEIQIIGQDKSLSKPNQIPIQRDGSLNIPEIGKVFVAGLSLESASSLIKNKISSAYIGTETFISLVNIRDIQVLIAGNANNPGVYTLNGNSNLLHAISMAGGINDLGSYREINVIRDNKIVGSIDLYDIFVLGKPNFGPKLRSGDSIFIKQADTLVNIVSGVNRPHVYELKEDENFSHAINFANDFKSTANLNYITVQRLEEGKIKVIDINKDDLNSTPIKHRDIVIVREYQYGTVTVEGAVNAPGEYSINGETTLKDIIISAGGYTNTAYPFGGFLDNKRTKEINKEARDMLYRQYIKGLASNLATVGSQSQAIPMLMNELKKSTISGRVMAEFDIDMINANPGLDTFLEDEDRIMIPFMTQQVYVYGEISNQGAIRYSPGKDIHYYLKNAGDILETGEKHTIFVVHPNGKTERLTGNKIFSNNNDVLIYPGSIIYIPHTASPMEGMQSAAIWAPIISSIALSLTSLSIINRDN